MILLCLQVYIIFIKKFIILIISLMIYKRQCFSLISSETKDFPTFSFHVMDQGLEGINIFWTI